MKKLFTYLMVGAISASTANAQTLFSEDFDNIGGPTAGGAGTYTFPAGWVLINADARTPNAAVAYVNEAWERREDLGNVGDSAAYSTSWYAPTGAANDWMWTPPIALTSNNVLKWNAKAQDAAFPDGYEVRIWTAGGTPTSVPGASTVLFSTPGETPTWTNRTVSLQTLGYTNQTVRIGFRNTSNDMFLLLIDDVEVITQNNYDVELTQQQLNSEYTIVPFSQLQPVSGTGTIRNSGLLAASNVNLQVDVYDGVPAVIATVPATPVASMAPGASSVFNTVAVTPPAVVDLYQFDFSAVMTQTDQIPSNNFLNEVPYLIVDETVYARDNATVTGSIGIGAGNGGYIGNAFEIFQATYLDSVFYYVTAGDAGLPTSAAVWNTVGGVPNTIIGTTETGFYVDDLAASITLGMQGGPMLLNPGEYVVTVVEYDSTLAVGYTDGIVTPGTTWINWPTNPNGTWSNSEEFDFNVTYVIRMILTDNAVGIDGSDARSSAVNVYPNPSNGNLTVALDGEEGKAQLLITDMAGRMVYSEAVVLGSNFKKNVSIDLSSGSYILNVVTEHSNFVQKIQIN
jgi:hypothetical protein